MPIETGDIVLTPGGCWHGLGHEGAEPAYWFDGLDVPLTHLLEPVFFDEHPDKYEKIDQVVTTSPFRFTRDEIARRLDAAPPDPDNFHGRRIVLAAPDMPTMSLAVDRLESGQRTRRCRSTVNTVFLAIEGSGERRIGDAKFAWQKGDTFVAPSWTKFEHAATSDSMLFILSDEPLLRFSNYYRFEAD
jgi:gentisate 1,2-dioxygenase